MRIVVAGSSGFIGGHLIPRLRSNGHEVVQLVRRPPSAADEVQWDPSTDTLDVDALTAGGPIDAGVNLAGAPLAGKRWDADYKRVIRSSRTDSTRTLATALATVGAGALVQGSAIGYYGQHHAADVIRETASAGTDFLADVCLDWENAARPAVDAGVRVACVRTGLVMGSDGGAFKPVVRTIKLGVGGPLGDPSAYWSWITMNDACRAIEFLLTNDVDGPVNLVGPDPVAQRDLLKAIGRALHRPVLARVPAPALKLALGEFADEILASRRVEPAVLLDAGFEFEQRTPAEAANWLARH